MRGVLLVALLWGCGHPAPPAPATPPPASSPGSTPSAGPPADAPPLDHDLPRHELWHDLPRLVARSVQLYQDVARVFAETGEDCAAAATRLGMLQQTYAEVVIANARVLREGRGKELKAALAPHDAELDAAAQAIMRSPTLAKCAQDPAFARAFDGLVGAPP